MSTIIYTVDGCPTVEKALEDFRLRGIEFEERNVYTRNDWLEEAEQLSPTRTVPIIITDGKIEHGFQGKLG